MNLTNVIATIAKLTGDATLKSYSTLGTGVEINLMPAGTDILALYPDLPIGQSFSFVCYDDLIIPPESTITLTQTDGEFVIGDQFIVRGEVMRQLMLGQYILKGVCVKKG